MLSTRRTAERRRRVLYTTCHADSPDTTAGRRRDKERLRQARRPTAAYGARVRRRLRGRWFSLVPVRRRTFVAVALALGLLAGLLCLGHYAAVAWPPLADHPELSRPLRLDRPDSLGSWVTCVLSLTSTGVCLLIYQLRRYRTDDFQGHYRIWRWVLLVMLLTGLQSLVRLDAWFGAAVDAVIGRRAVMAGQDWVRIVLTLGGAAMALRLLAETRRCRTAAAILTAGWLTWGTLAAAVWNLITVDTLARWMLVTCAPLWGHTLWLVGFGTYLRMLYREVRGISDQPPRRSSEPVGPGDRRSRGVESPPGPALADRIPTTPARWRGLAAQGLGRAVRALLGPVRWLYRPSGWLFRPLGWLYRLPRWLACRCGALFGPLGRLRRSPGGGGGRGQDGGGRGQAGDLQAGDRGQDGMADQAPAKPRVTGETEAEDGTRQGSDAGPREPRSGPAAAGGNDGENDDRGEPIDKENLSKAERRRLRKQLRRQGRAA